jgi:hypothetical protein
MLTASIATVIIVLIMAGIFLRYGRRGYSLSILPLVTVPLFYSLSVFLADMLTKNTQIRIQVVASTVLGAVVIAGILFGLCSLIFKSKTTKTSYLVCCGLFTLIFAIVLLLNIIS